MSVHLAEILGVWANGEGPLYRQLAAAIIAAIERRDLSPGTKLPPERKLAHDLAVSRTTVVAAFAHLKEYAWLDAIQGSGTWVAHPSRSLDVRLPESDVAASYPVRRLLRATSQEIPSLVEMAGAAFYEPIGIQDALIEAARGDGFDGPGYLPFGHPSLRTAVADDLSARGLPTAPSQILITTGVAQATALLASLYLPDGEPVIIENPTWTGLLDVMRANGSRIRSVPVDQDGACIDELPELVERSSANLVAVVPDFNNPTGVQLSLGRRRTLAAMAERLQLPVVENLALAALRLADTPPLPPIATFSPDRWIITVGSWSKVVWAGLRVGWVRASEPTIARLARLKAMADNGTPIASQLAAVVLIRDMDEIAELRREQAARAYRSLTGALSELLPTWTWKQPDGGLSLWTQLPSGTAFELSQAALRHSVEFSPGPVFCHDESHQDFLRLPFVAPDVIIEEAVQRLAAAWDTYSRQARFSGG